MKFNIWEDCPKVPITELLSFIVDNRGKTVPTANDGWKLIATNCVTNNTLFPVYEKVRYLTQETYETWFRAHPMPGDILFVNKGTPGRVCMVPDPVDFCIAQDMIALRADDKKIYNKYLFAVLRSREIQQQIYNTNVGDVIPHFKKQFMDQLLIPVPDRKIQEKIGNLYYQLSYKVELNKKINENLEQQLQLLYDQLTYDLKGETIELSSVIEVRDGTHDSPKPKENGFPLVTSKHLLPFGVDLTSCNLISQADYNKINERSAVDTYDILLSMIGTVGLVSLVIENPVTYAIKNVGLFKTSKRPELYAFILAYLKSKKTMQHIEKTLAGSTQKYISLGELRKMPIILPTVEQLSNYNEIANPLIKQIITLTNENKTLNMLRDSILPKLMSGEIDVSAIDI